MNNGFLRVAAANPVIRVADPEYNAGVISDIIKKAETENVELLVFPELCVTGYTCGDLFFNSELVSGAERALCKILDCLNKSDILVFVGLPIRSGGKLYNACAVLQRGAILAVIPKTNLPEYGEFNELRYFASGENAAKTVFLCGKELPLANTVLRFGEVTVSAEICEDLWAPVSPAEKAGALITVNLSASSETAGKAQKRRALVLSRSLRNACAYIYADAGRGESTTDLVFSGHSLIAENGSIIAENAPFENNVLTISDIDTDLLLFERAKNNTINFGAEKNVYADFALPERENKTLCRKVPRLPFVPQGADKDDCAELMLKIQSEGLMHRLTHTNAEKLVLGVSGGLDSALALLVCLRALDSCKRPRKDLVAISMPGFGTSEETAENALMLAKDSKADYRIIDIKPSVTRHLSDIGHNIENHDTAYENAQARMRTMILMDIANKENGIVVGTGDLSEAALGWCTYGGDHMSMYGVNSSVPKTLVKSLVAYEAERIGGKTKNALTGILNTEISPELLPSQNGKISQKTEDIIGSFELNDFFIFYAVRCGCSPKKTLMYAAAAFGGSPRDYSESLVKFYKRFFASQFKRSCSPDGVKTDFSFSPRGDWRMPSDACVNLFIKAAQNDKAGI